MRHALLVAAVFLSAPFALHAAKPAKAPSPTPAGSNVIRPNTAPGTPTPPSLQKPKTGQSPAAKPVATPAPSSKPALAPGSKSAATPGKPVPPPATRSSKPTPAPPGSANSSLVLLIGDSLSVGPFGTTLQDLLIARLGSKEVALYASCGSSPEHWLASEPVYETRCGYREKTPRSQKLIDFVNGRRPPPVATPKLERLLKMHEPRYVLIQLGTNWMDEFQKRVSTEKKVQKSAILDRFAAALRGRIVVWILPPDSAHYSSSAQNTVRELIHRCVVQNGFAEIDSKKLTRYRRGKTGSDGIHYNGEDARVWAQGVMGQLTGKSSR